MIDKTTKKKIIDKFKTHDNDTGSPQVQIAILTEEINRLTEHLKMHKHDHSSRRGLLKKVGERRRLIKFLQRENRNSLEELAQKLKLKLAKKLINEEEEKRKAEEAAIKEKEEREEKQKQEEKNKENIEKENKPEDL